MHYVSVHAGCKEIEIDNKILTAQVIVLNALPHQEMVTSHSSYNTLPSFCAAGSLHTARLVSVQQ